MKRCKFAFLALFAIMFASCPSGSNFDLLWPKKGGNPTDGSDAQNEADFGAGATIDGIFTVYNEATWNTARAAITINGNYIINITADFFVTESPGYTFGTTTSGIKVSIRGRSQTISCSYTSSSALLRITTDQKVILRNLTLKEHDGNLPYMVTIVNNSELVMESGAKITGGGGVAVAGTFTMNDGTISGNTSGGQGGGVRVSNNISSIFRIVTGTVCGSNEANAALRNTAATGAALYKRGSSTAQNGTFSGSTWNGTDLPSSVDGANSYNNNTIRVVNGVLQ